MRPFFGPDWTSAPARRGKMLLELHQGKTCAGRIAALVAAADARSGQGLLAAVAGKNAVAERHGMLDGKRVQAGGGLARHDLVMARFPADHAAKGNTAAMAPGAADEAIGKRE